MRKTGEFVQPHKSFFVNLRYIRALQSNMIVMDDGKSIPIARKRLSEIQKRYIGFVSRGDIWRIPLFRWGGKGTHTVLAAHRRLASKALFTDLDRVKKGDVFYIHVLEEILAYRVVEIYTVTPERTELLNLEEQEDYVTLVTCTPYGINSHRLLVRGSRIPYEEAGEVTAGETESGFWVWGRRVFIASAVILIIFGILLFWPRKRREGGEK